MEAYFYEVSGLSAEIVIENYEEGGLNTHAHRLPGRIKYADITLKRGLFESKNFWDEWCGKVFEGKFTGQRKNITIYLYNAKGETVKSWLISEAFPSKWTGPNLKADSNNVAVETLVLVHNGFKETK